MPLNIRCTAIMQKAQLSPRTGRLTINYSQKHSNIKNFILLLFFVIFFLLLILMQKYHFFDRKTTLYQNVVFLSLK